jgi:Gluconate 2-dehydrogenase subunit 3
MDVARRSFLKGVGALGLLALANPARVAKALGEGPAAGQAGFFLKAHERETLRAVCARLIPGPPDDPDPGAVEAGVPEAIDLLLGAFNVDPPLIHAGGPFSNRAGASHDDFADFVPLDHLAELSWRIRLEGSKGKPEREFAGPVTGLQEVYRTGLAHLDERAGGNFSALPGPAQDLILSDQTDSAVQDFVGTALSDVLDATYGPPEYGGNRNLVGWTVNHWPGDTQPRGFTPEQVSNPDPQPATPALSAKAAAAALKFLPALAGQPAARTTPWRARPGYERG